ncbi:hypothetical protein FOZ61_001753, partial [Perkinsus olseni]
DIRTDLRVTLAMSVQRGLLRFSRVARSGAGDVKPRWTLPSKDYLKYCYQPSIPDKHYFGAHWNYVPATMWLRARRPAMENIGKSMYGVVKESAQYVTRPLGQFVQYNCPGFLHKVVAVFGLWMAYSLTLRYTYGDMNNNWFYLDKMHSYAQANELADKGFWDTKQQAQAKKEKEYSDTCNRLNDLWDKAISEATEARSFGKLYCLVRGPSYNMALLPCEALKVDEEDALPLEGVPNKVQWRFGMIPYGSDNPDTQLFPTPEEEQPAGAYQFMDPSSYGDYIERVDNKPNPLRKARHLFTSAYMPPTK